MTKTTLGNLIDQFHRLKKSKSVFNALLLFVVLATPFFAQSHCSNFAIVKNSSRFQNLQFALGTTKKKLVFAKSLLKNTFLNTIARNITPINKTIILIFTSVINDTAIANYCY